MSGIRVGDPCRRITCLRITCCRATWRTSPTCRVANLGDMSSRATSRHPTRSPQNRGHSSSPTRNPATRNSATRQTVIYPPHLQERYKAEDRLREFFNRRAEETPAQGQPRSRQPALNQTIEQMGLCRDDRVLDIGCGDGGVCRLLSPLCPEGSVAGLDISDGMIRLAREQSVGFENVLYAPGAAEEIPWAEDYFTRIVAIESAYYWPSPETALREIFRVANFGAEIFSIAKPLRGKPPRPSLAGGLRSALALEERRGMDRNSQKRRLQPRRERTTPRRRRRARCPSKRRRCLRPLALARTAPGFPPHRPPAPARRETEAVSAGPHHRRPRPAPTRRSRSRPATNPGLARVCRPATRACSGKIRQLFRKSPSSVSCLAFMPDKTANTLSREAAAGI